MLGAWLRDLVRGRWEIRREAPPQAPIDDKLVARIDVTVDAFCPCGSTHIHHLTLVSTSDCARCGRTLGVRSFQYVRSTINEAPMARVSVGYVVTREALRRRRVGTEVH